MAHSRRFNRSRNSNTLCSRRWDDGSSFDKETEQSSRHKDDFSGVNNSKITNRMSRDTVSYNDKEEFSEDPDNFRDYHESNFTERYNASNNVSYKEHNEEYLHEQWSSDGEREERYLFFDGDQTGWDSEYSGGNEHYSEREYYEREEVCIIIVIIINNNNNNNNKCFSLILVLLSMHRYCKVKLDGS